MSNILTTKEKTILGFSIVGIIMFVLFALAFPLIVIWSINTLLFPVFSIPYSFSTYIATIVITWITTGRLQYHLMKIEKKL